MGSCFVIGVMSSLSLQSMLRNSRGVDLGDENPGPVCRHVLSFLAFIVKDEHSGLQEIVRWHHFFWVSLVPMFPSSSRLICIQYQKPTACCEECCQA